MSPTAVENASGFSTDSFSREVIIREMGELEIELDINPKI